MSSNFRQKFLEARIRIMTKNRNEATDIPGAREAAIQREEDRDFERWKTKIKKRLPELAQRVFALRNEHYNGCGFHYDLETKLGRVIYDTSNTEGYYRIRDGIERLTFRIALDLNVRYLFRNINRAEKEIKELKNND